MVNFTVVHDLSCNLQTYYNLFKSTNFNEKLYQETAPFTKLFVLQQSETDADIARKTYGNPTAGMPEPMASWLGSGFGYVVDARLDKATNVWTFKFTPSSFTDQLKLQGSVKLEPTGANALKCTANVSFEANVFAIGGVIEAFVQSQFTSGWASGASFTNQWLAQGNPIQ